MRIQIHVDWDTLLVAHPDPLQWIKDIVFSGWTLKIASSMYQNDMLSEVLQKLGVPEYEMTASHGQSTPIKLFYGPFPDPFMVNKEKYPITGSLPPVDHILRFAREKQRERDERFKG